MIRNGAWTGDTLRRWRVTGLQSERKEPMTQEQAAAWYGVHERTWRRWERGEIKVPTPLILRISAEKRENQQ